VEAPADWAIVSFSLEQGMGRIRSATTGDEVTFAVESWWPCDPVTARRLQDSELRRPLLLPQAGEPVDVEWKVSRAGENVPARVGRRRAVGVLPLVTFSEWLTRVGRHVPEVADWGDDEWAALFRELDEDIEDTVRSLEPVGPEQHLAVLGWLREHAPPAFVARRLQWLTIEPRSDLVAVEATNDEGHVRLALPRATVDALVEEKLLAVTAVLAPAPAPT
jgi:hypothetical protein